ncbi:MAG: ATP-binding protein, partial [Anaerolineales bacterium]
TDMTIISELRFTFYTTIHDRMVVYAHLVRALAFFLVYKALIEGSLLKPYETIFQSLSLSRSELRQKTRQLEAHVQELDAFGHTVAHELRGPLSTIITTTETVINFDMPKDEQRSFLNGIVGTSKLMSRIVDELMILAQIGTADVPKHIVNMDIVLEQALDRLSSLSAMENALILRPSPLPSAYGYAPWIEQVWVNYISNAIKYGGKPPRLEFGANTLPNGFIRFWLQDNGPGMAQDKIDAMFNSYTRPNRGRLGSHGLGLTIVKGIIKKLGGEVGVSVKDGVGSRFHFSLPAPDDPEDRASEGTTPEPPEAVEAPTLKS